MTPEEIERNAVTIMGMLRASGVTPQAAAIYGAMNDAAQALERERGRQAPPPNFNQAEVDAALQRGPRVGPDPGAGLLGPSGPPPLPPPTGMVDYGNMGLVRSGDPPPEPMIPLTDSVHGFDRFSPESQAAAHRVHSERVGQAMQNEVVGDLVNTGMMAAAGPVSRGASWVGRQIAANPRVSAALGGIGGVLTTPGSTQEQPPANPELTRARTTAAERAAALKNAETELESARVAGRRFSFRDAQGEERSLDFSSINTGSPRADIMALQRFLANPANGGHYRGNIDGQWRLQTQAALTAYQEANKAAQERADSALSTARADDLRARERVESLEGTDNYRAAERNMSTLGWIAREFATPLSIAGGLAAGIGARALNSARINAANRAAARDNNALINPGGTLNERVANTNTLFARGGGNQPFRVDPNTPHGVVAAPGQTTGNELFAAAPNFLQRRIDPVDAGAVLGIGALGARSEFMVLPEARRELDDAREEYRRNRSPENAERVTRAEGNYYQALIMARGSWGALGGYGAASFRGRDFPRPDVNRIGQEVLDINRLLQGRPPPVEIWRSPSGRDVIVRYRPNGPYFNLKNDTIAELTPHRRRTWTRD